MPKLHELITKYSTDDDKYRKYRIIIDIMNTEISAYGTYKLLTVMPIELNTILSLDLLKYATMLAVNTYSNRKGGTKLLKAVDNEYKLLRKMIVSVHFNDNEIKYKNHMKDLLDFVCLCWNNDYDDYDDDDEEYISKIQLNKTI